MAFGDGSNTIKRIQAERDHYQRDAEKLQEEITKMTALLQEKQNDAAEEAENNLKLRRKLNEQDQELVKLHQCIQDLNYEKQNLQKRIDGKIISAVARSAMTSPVMEGPGQSVRIATETQVTEHARLEKTIMESEDRVRRLELERRELMATTGVQKATINNLEDELETLREKFNGSQTELTQQRTLYTQIKSLQDQTDRALADSQGQLAQLEAELANSRDRVRVLESDRASLDREVSSLKTEQTVLRGNIAQVDQEKDALLMSIDSKTEQIAQLERQLKLIENKCVDLEGNVAELQRKLDISLEESAAREQALRAAAREAEVLRAELQTLERARDGLLRENRRLQDDVASAAQDARQANRELQAAQDEVDALKRQVQEYVAEIRRIEEMLAHKENERTEMLEQFRGLSVEATLLESNNHSLESEAAENKHHLHVAEERITDLEQQLETRDSLVQSYENQIAELSGSIASLETQLQQFMENRQKTDADLDALRDLCVKLDSQKEVLQQELNKQDVVKIQWESDMSRLQDEQELLQEQLSKDRANIASLENMLASSRQETAEQRHQNEQLKADVERLQLRVDTLQSKLDAETEELHRYQYQANEYSKQIKDLQRQITNERFERARTTEETRRVPDTCCPAPGNLPHPPSPAGISAVHSCASSPPHLHPTKTPQPDDRNRICAQVPQSAPTTGYTRRRPMYMTPPPSTDWGAFKASLHPRGAPPSYTTEPCGLQSCLPCTRASCPYIQQSRPIYMTAPRSHAPLVGPPPESGFYVCNPGCPFNHVARPVHQPRGVHVNVHASASGNPPPQTTIHLTSEKSAKGDITNKCCPCSVSPGAHAQQTDREMSDNIELAHESEPVSSDPSGEGEILNPLTCASM